MRRKISFTLFQNFKKPSALNIIYIAMTYINLKYYFNLINLKKLIIKYFSIKI